MTNDFNTTILTDFNRVFALRQGQNATAEHLAHTVSFTLRHLLWLEQNDRAKA